MSTSASKRFGDKTLAIKATGRQNKDTIPMQSGVDRSESVDNRSQKPFPETRKTLKPILDRHFSEEVWWKLAIPRSRDIRQLLKPTKSGAKGFETVADKVEQRQKLIDVLAEAEPELADALADCSPATPCLIPGCPHCRRLRRGYLFSETARVYHAAHAHPRLFVTVILDEIPAGQLDQVYIPRVHKRFQKRLARKGVRGLLIGGTEVNWDPKKRVWVLHLHILSVGISESDWDRVIKGSKMDRAYPIKKRAIKDWVRALSYLQKWVTYFRPHRQTGGKKSPTAAMKPEQIAEVCRWWAAHRFDDFMFLYGARRRWGKIDVETRFDEVGSVGSVGIPHLIFRRTTTVEFDRDGAPTGLSMRDEAFLPEQIVRRLFPASQIARRPDAISALPNLPLLIASRRGSKPDE